MHRDIVTTHTKVFMRSHMGRHPSRDGGAARHECAGIPCPCSIVLCVVVSTIVLVVLASVITVPLVQGRGSLADPAHVVSVMSETEQRRLILIARQDCFRLSEEREQQLQNGTAPISSGCEVTWDKILCWDLAKPGTTVTQKCPDYINHFNKNEFASRYCTEKGTWQFYPENNGSWTNYSNCTRPTIDLTSHAAHGDRIRLLYTVGYSISLGTLLIAVFIMFCCKRLHSKSNTLHINLFLAFILRAILAFAKDLMFVGDIGLAKDVTLGEDGIYVFVHDAPHWECRMLFTIFMYSVSACNMWIFAEALYLTVLVQRPLVTERKGVRAYVVLGWSLPLLSIVPWVIVKAMYENTYCWNIHHNPAYYWILRGAGVSVVVINLFLFLNIFRKLFLKIRHSSELGATGKAKYRRLAKFILVLIPLFGIMYLVFYVVIPGNFVDDSFNVAYLYLEMTYNSFQGFLLALLFCFLNEEVHSELRRVWYRHRYLNGDPTAFTRSFAASSCRKTQTTSSGRSQSPALGPHVPLQLMHKPAQTATCHKMRTLSSSSQELDKRCPELLTTSEKRRMRLMKALSQDPEPVGVEREQADKLLRLAIKGNVASVAAKRAALRKQSTVSASSYSGGELSPLTLTPTPVCESQKFVFDRNRNTSSSEYL